MVRSLKNKKAAFEMSMTTIIVIVLSVVFLILGLGLIRQIYGSATGSISTVDDKLKTQLTTLFAEDTASNVFVRPEDGLLKVRAGTSDFGFVIGGKTLDGNGIPNWNQMQYRLILDPQSDCYKRLGAASVKKWFTNAKIATDTEDMATLNVINWAIQSDVGLARLTLSIPKGTPTCQQTVQFNFIDKTGTEGDKPLDSASFNIQILRQALV